MCVLFPSQNVIKCIYISHGQGNFKIPVNSLLMTISTHNFLPNPLTAAVKPIPETASLAEQKKTE